MKLYVLFKMNDADFSSKGETFEGSNEIEALGVFRQKYPTSVYIGSYSEKASALLQHQLEYADKFSNPQLIPDHEDHQASEAIKLHQANKGNLYSGEI